MVVSRRPGLRGVSLGVSTVDSGSSTPKDRRSRTNEGPDRPRVLRGRRSCPGPTPRLTISTHLRTSHIPLSFSHPFSSPVPEDLDRRGGPGTHVVSGDTTCEVFSLVGDICMPFVPGSSQPPVTSDVSGAEGLDARWKSLSEVERLR